MRGKEIIVSAEPKGHFLEGIISGTPKPGTVMEIVAGTAADANGRFTWRAYTGISGAKCLICILLSDDLQGGTETTAYVSGSRAKLYIPLAGDQLNMLFADVAGTADDHTIGEFCGVQTATGKIIVNSSFTTTPFICLEAVTDPVADFLAWCYYTGY